MSDERRDTAGPSFARRSLCSPSTRSCTERSAGTRRSWLGSSGATSGTASRLIRAAPACTKPGWGSAPAALSPNGTRPRSRPGITPAWPWCALCC